MGKDREARARVPPTAFKAGQANSTSVRENERAAKSPNAAAHRSRKRKSREPLGHEVLIEASGAPDPRPAPGSAAKRGRNSIELVKRGKKKRHSGSDDDDDDDDDGDSSSGEEDSEHSSEEDADCTDNGRNNDDQDDAEDSEEMDADDDNGEEDKEELLQSGATKLARRKDSAPRKAGAIKIHAEEDLSQVLIFFIEYPVFLNTTC